MNVIYRMDFCIIKLNLIIRLGPIGASIVAISPNYVLNSNPALVMGKPTMDSMKYQGPQIIATDTESSQTTTGGKNYL